MNILDRYITREYLRFFFISLAAMIGLFLAADSLRVSFSHNTETIVILKYYMYMVPELAVKMIPMACLVASLLALSFMNRKNELVAMYSAGVSLFRISYVILSLTFVISCLSFVVQDRVVPNSSREKTLIYYREIKGRKDFSTTIKLSRVWYRSKNLIYNIENMDFSKNTLYGMSLYYFNEKFDLIQYIEATEAKWIKDSDWELSKGRLTVFENSGRKPLSKMFDTKKIILTETPKDFKEIEKEVDSLKIKELYSFIKRTKEAGFDTKAYEVKFHSRISIAIVPIIMAFLGIPFATRSHRHNSPAADIGTAVALAFIYWLLFSVGVSLGNRGLFNPMLSTWIANILFAFIGIYIVVKERK